MPLAPGTSLGPYEIVSAIGAGGMGEVYKARDTRLDRTVAIKVLPEHVASDPDLTQRFEREARARGLGVVDVGALESPIVTVAGFGMDLSGNYAEVRYGFSAAELDFTISGILNDSALAAELPGQEKTPNLTLVFGMSKTFGLN